MILEDDEDSHSDGSKGPKDIQGVADDVILWQWLILIMTLASEFAGNVDFNPYLNKHNMNREMYVDKPNSYQY